MWNLLDGPHVSFQLDRDRDARKQGRMPDALDASSHQDGAPLAFSVLQLEHLGGDGQVSQAGTPPGLAPLSHSWTVTDRADPQDPLPTLWLCP